MFSRTGLFLNTNIAVLGVFAVMIAAALMEHPPLEKRIEALRSS